MKSFVLASLTSLLSAITVADELTCKDSIDRIDTKAILELCDESKLNTSLEKFIYARALREHYLPRYKFDAYYVFGVYKADEDDLKIMQKIAELTLPEAETGKGEAPIVYAILSSILAQDSPDPLENSRKAELASEKWFKLSAESGNPHGMFLYGMQGVDKRTKKITNVKKFRSLASAAIIHEYQPAILFLEKMGIYKNGHINQEWSN
ncbi:hypothetical protein MAH1_14140 [Sessilibacter sp. MAH1]